MMSTAGGSGWVEIDNYFQQYSPIDIEFDALQENTIWYCGQKSNSMAVSWTHNYGNSWSRKILNSAVSEALAVEIDPQNGDIVWVAGGSDTQSFVYRTIDGGDLWQIVSIPEGSGRICDLQIHPDSSSTIFIVSENGIFKSADEGNAWEMCFDKPSSALLIDPVNTQRMYIATEGFGVWITHDCGEQWEELGQGLADPVGSDLALYPGKWLFVATAGTGVFRYDLNQLGCHGGEIQSGRPAHISVPSPVRGNIVFSLEMPVSGFASLEVYNIYGRLIATPLNALTPAGSSFVCWTPGEFTAPGCYMYKFESDGFVITGKVILVR